MINYGILKTKKKIIPKSGSVRQPIEKERIRIAYDVAINLTVATRNEKRARSKIPCLLSRKEKTERDSTKRIDNTIYFGLVNRRGFIYDMVRYRI